MNANILSSLSQLSNQELLTQVKLLVQREREATSLLIAHLAVLDERRLYLAEGCSSLFTYCTQVLHLSEHAVYNRIEAARAARRFPVILEMLSDGLVNLTTVRLLAPHLTFENHRELLDAVRHKSNRQVEELVARLWPQPPVPSSIRRLPTPSFGAAMAPDDTTDSHSDVRTATGFLPTSGAPDLQPAGSVVSLPAPAQAPMPISARPAVISPLTPERYRVQFTASAETHSKLRLAQDLLRHQIPDGDVGQIIDRALAALLEDLAKQKFAATDRPRGSHDDCRSHGAVPSSRHIPAGVKRTVWIRDGGRCAFVACNGRRCTERAFLEFHHVVPHSTGGEATVDNIQLRCRAHNGHEAELYFGQPAAPC